MNQITLFLCGDVMLGRGIDQILPNPSDPILYEPYMKSALGYVELAEEAGGPIPRPVDFSYAWGEALSELGRMAPDVRIINLETSVTTSPSYWRSKEVHYKMNPANMPCITAGGINCCALANNHIMDWGYPGLAETLDALKSANVKSSGAGMNLEEAGSPSVMEVAGKGRVIVFSLGSVTSGIPRSWEALVDRPGVNLLKDCSDDALRRFGEKVRQVKRDGDVVVASIHWGANWGYDIGNGQMEFAHGLVDRRDVDIVHGHSSHHVKGIEVYKDKPILYGCGDFINDYEGIGGYEAYRADLGLMYFLTMDALTGELLGMQMTPTQIKRFRVNRAAKEDALWLRDTLNREGKRLGTRVQMSERDALILRWLPEMSPAL